jgi:hypothetical protein
MVAALPPPTGPVLLPARTGAQARAAMPAGPPVSSVLATVCSAPLALVGGGLVAARVAGMDLALDCPMWVLFGAACPFCGVTRGATALVTGDAPMLAAQAPAVAIVVAMALMSLVVGLGWLRGRVTPRPRHATVYLALLGAALAVNWVWQLDTVGVL